MAIPRRQKIPVVRFDKVSELGIPADYSITREGTSQSLLGSWLSCQQKFVIAVNRLQAARNNGNTNFGTIFHEFLDRTYSMYRDTGKVAGVREIKLFSTAFQEKGEAGGEFSGMDEELVEKNFHMSEIVLSQYIKFWKNDFTDYKFHEIEKVFDVPFHDKYRLRGKRDGMLIAKDKTLWLFEHKTKSRVMEDAIKAMLPMDFQSLFYGTAFTAETGRRISGVQYNIIRNSQIKPKKGESLKLLGNRLTSEIVKDPSHFFKRYPQAYTAGDFTRFSANLLKILEQIESFEKSGSAPIQNYTQCQGQFTCNHLAACTADKLSFYKQKPVLFTELEE